LKGGCEESDSYLFWVLAHQQWKRKRNREKLTHEGKTVDGDVTFCDVSNEWG
jgi:hypothetical protein